MKRLFAFFLFSSSLFASQDSYDLFGTAEFIYWRFSSPFLFYGRDGIGLTNSPIPQEIPVTKKGTSFFPHFNYRPGFKAGLGIQFGCEKAFDLYARYIWIYSEARGSVSQEDISASFLPLDWLSSNSLESSTYHTAGMGVGAHSQWIELQSGYTFDINRYLTLRPYIALTSIIVNGGIFVNYFFTPPNGVPEIARTHGECDSWSICPKVGLDVTFHATDHFGIYCNGNILHQTAQINMHTKQRNERPTTGEKFVIQRGELSQKRCGSLVGLEIGPTWDQWFGCDCYHLQVRATWQTMTLSDGNLAFLGSNNVAIPVGAEFRGFNIRILFEF